MSRHTWGEPYRTQGKAWPIWPAVAYGIVAWAALAWAVWA